MIQVKYDDITQLILDLHLGSGHSWPLNFYFISRRKADSVL